MKNKIKKYFKKNVTRRANGDYTYENGFKTTNHIIFKSRFLTLKTIFKTTFYNPHEHFLKIIYNHIF